MVPLRAEGLKLSTLPLREVHPAANAIWRDLVRDGHIVQVLVKISSFPPAGFSQDGAIRRRGLPSDAPLFINTTFSEG